MTKNYRHTALCRYLYPDLLKAIRQENVRLRELEITSPETMNEVFFYLDKESGYSHAKKKSLAEFKRQCLDYKEYCFKFFTEVVFEGNVDRQETFHMCFGGMWITLEEPKIDNMWIKKNIHKVRLYYKDQHFLYIPPLVRFSDENLPCKQFMTLDLVESVREWYYGTDKASKVYKCKGDITKIADHFGISEDEVRTCLK